MNRRWHTPQQATSPSSAPASRAWPAPARWLRPATGSPCSKSEARSAAAWPAATRPSAASTTAPSTSPCAIRASSRRWRSSPGGAQALERQRGARAGSAWPRGRGGPARARGALGRRARHGCAGRAHWAAAAADAGALELQHPGDAASSAMRSIAGAGSCSTSGAEDSVHVFSGFDAVLLAMPACPGRAGCCGSRRVAPGLAATDGAGRQSRRAGR